MTKSMRERGFFLFLSLMLCFQNVLTADDKDKNKGKVGSEPEPSATKKIIVDQVLPAYRVDNKFALEIAIKKLASRMKHADIDLVNKELKANEIESLDRLFLSVRLPKIAYSSGPAAPTSSVVELQVALSALNADTQKRFNKLLEDMEFAKLVPKTIREFEQKLQHLAVIDGRISGLVKQIHYIEHLRKQGRRDYRKHLEKVGAENPLAQLIAKDDSDKQLKNLKAIRVKAIEEELRTRIFRLENAIDDLAQTDVSAKTKIEAGMVIAVDGKVVPQLLTKNRDQIRHPDLTDEELPGYIKSIVADATLENTKWVEIGGRLFFGMQYWLQGRFGNASDFGGLVKMPFTFSNASAQGELRMPPFPYSKRIENRTNSLMLRPNVERRHLYVSAYPYRQFDCSRMVPYVPTGPTASRTTKKGKSNSTDKKSSGRYVTGPAKSHISRPAASHISRPAASYVIGPGPMYRMGVAGSQGGRFT